jgi:hypothetical protein
MFSGLAATISEAQPKTHETATSNHCNQDNSQGCPVPCGSEVCPLCICVTADVVLISEMQVRFHISELGYPDVSDAIPDPYIAEIFHPPTSFSSVSWYS